MQEHETRPSQAETGAEQPTQVAPDQSQTAQPSPEDADTEGGPRFSLDVASQSASEALQKLRENVQYWAARGRYNKVRVKRKGKAILPDIPIGALVAVEAATFFWAGLLRAALANTVGRAFFEVELISEAEPHYRLGLEHFLAGEIPQADAALEKALAIDPRYGRAHLQQGILRKTQGQQTQARRCFERAVRFSTGRVRKEAQKQLERLDAGTGEVITVKESETP